LRYVFISINIILNNRVNFMKRKIFLSIGITAILIIAAINVNLGSRDGQLSDLTLANIEALGQSENDGGNSSDTTCDTCCDPDCTDCYEEQYQIRCLSKSSCYNARFTVNTCSK
jgi:hypothetical protein